MGFTTRRAALGAADLERAARGDRRPLAMFYSTTVREEQVPSLRSFTAEGEMTNS